MSSARPEFGRRALEAFETPEIQAWLELMKEDGTFDRWVEGWAA